ncbi:lysylphosphatidylglycerol synthase transmembrane domain-containing protein [Granulicella arctica]|uniref:lysylphosphatidylglycerol synthase transmembrane domain-containing protein n=1 Tax=Granulicella arctica TaxID=940613 RepID=UPI0021DF4F2F|nr:lysylphosphatidylglycerol synthase transmembrane domain-containing protein [Granulicella arctica]
MTDSSPKKQRNLLKTLPGLLISAFFLWYTFHKITFAEFRAVRLVQPIWIVGVLAFTLASYTLRCLRWTRMMLPTGASFGVCARVLMTSLAANNILPLRIGDIMRVFTYAGDLGTSPSVILSTVILEKLLDIFVLGLLFVSTMGSIATHSYHVAAYTSLAISFAGLLVLLVGAKPLQPRLAAIFQKLPTNGIMTKLEHWITLALDATARLGVGGSLLLLVYSAVIWTCEGMIFVSALKLVGVPTDRVGPWLAVSFANLSYLIPSSPGAIGPFELAVKTSLVSHGAPASQSALFGLMLHVWLLISITGAGGIIFLLHRIKIHNHTPLLTEIETLPVELP